jgi:diguanylate cyclase (GGDEF)-like protein/PAS domain S-box-containing protein
MLSYDPGVRVSYEPVTTVASLLIAFAVTACGFFLAPQGRKWSPAAGGAVVGAGIGAMHYAGMNALIVPGTLSWNGSTVVASLMLGVGLTSAALVVFHRERDLKANALSALLLTLAICGLHFTAMAAVTVIPDPLIQVAASSFDNSSLAVAVSAVTSVLLVSGLAAALVETEARKRRTRVDEDFRRTSVELAQETEERRRLFETSLDLILITDRRGHLIRVSPSSEATLGYSPDEMIGRSAAEFVYPEDLEATRKEMRQARGGRSTRNFETRYLHKDGRAVALAWSGVWSEPEQRHFFVGRDMTERKLAEERLRTLAHYDQLTGLPNRVTLHDHLGELTRTMGIDPEAVSVALFDLDGFKDINDTLGHSVGDSLLKDVARRMGAVALGTGARIYRSGGDEFVLVVSDRRHQCVVTGLVASLLGQLAEGFEVGGHNVFVGASAGIATGPQHGTDIEQLMSNADLALYSAKGAGGGIYRVFQPVLRARAQARRDLDADLRRAFAEGEFVVHYQPQIRLADGRLTGAEALLRWNHPQRGFLTPGSFIEALSESDVALDLGRWILRTACASAATWQAKGHAIRIGVNLFPAHFREGSLREDVEAALLEAGLRPDALELEITENIALGHDGDMIASLRAIRDMGVGLAFDDFGTGYASLSYLTLCPLSRIKIDRSFVGRIDENSTSEDSAVVRAIIGLAHNLGLRVTAEGVELAVQEAFLRAEHCDEAQGFHYARALPSHEFERFARSSTACMRHAMAG